MILSDSKHERLAAGGEGTVILPDARGISGTPDRIGANQSMAAGRGTGNLDFIDGYLYRVMRDSLAEQGRDASGFYEYYENRIEVLRAALSSYDRALLEYFARSFNGQNRKVVHAGIGIGTLTVSLAIRGFVIAGIERDARRFAAASRLREAAIHAWPEVAERYFLIEGVYPDVVADTSWISSGAVLVFTNCSASWSDQLTSKVIACFPRYGDIVFDSRLFGRVREADDREILLSEIRKCGITLERVPGMPPNSFYYHGRPNTDSVPGSVRA